MPQPAPDPKQGELLALKWLLCLVFLVGCAGIQPMGVGEPGALLELQVEPPTAEVYVDDEYSGVVNRWAGQTMPIQPGERRVELRAEGYLTQRFDVDAVEGQLHTLRVRMEREFHLDGGLEEEEGELW